MGLLDRFKKPKVVYQLVNLDTGEVVDEANVSISKGDLQDMVELGDYPDVDYRLVRIENDKKRTVWKLTRKLPKQEIDASDLAKMTDEEAMKFLVDKRNKLQKDSKEFEKVVEQFGDSHGENAVIGAILTPKDGLNRGLGTALYKGFSKRPDNVVDRLLDSLDGLTMLLKGGGIYLAKHAGESVDGYKEKGTTVKKDDGGMKTSFGDGEEDATTEKKKEDEEV